jgi:uncharacterized small protein (DUF1192 family)
MGKGRGALAEEPADARHARGQALLDLSREDLDPYGIEELHERVAVLEAEIVRTSAHLDRKQSSRAAADALFAKRD